MTANTVRFGIVGAGMMAKIHANALVAAQGAEFVGVTSRGSEKRKELADAYGVTEYPSLEAMLSDPNIDAITIATPSGSHGEVALAAARHNKHILCEKPLETNPACVQEIIDTCRAYKVLLAPVFQFRKSPGALLIKRALDADRFGKILFSSAKIKWFRPQAYYDAAPWRGTWLGEGGGCLMNQSIHVIDLMLHFGGTPEEVYGYINTSTHGIQVEDTGVAVVRFAGGTMGVIESSTSCAPGVAFEVSVSGEKGTATLTGGTITQWTFVDKHPLDAEVLLHEEPSPLGCGLLDANGAHIAEHVTLIEDLVAAINGDSHRLIDGKEARLPVDVVCGIYESVRTGQPVSLKGCCKSH